MMYLLPLSLILLMFLSGCMSSELYSNTYIAQDKNVASADAQAELQKLARLWQVRTEANLNADYPLGAGDELDVSVPAMPELGTRTVRIVRDGTITLPFIGKIQAAGLTGEVVEQTVAERLKTYMKRPRISLFVKKYHSRQVAVLGAVPKPGLYSLTGSNDTLLDMLSQAGGMLQGADPKIYLIPAEPVVDKQQVAQISATLPDSLLQQDSVPLILKRTDPIQIDLKQLALGADQKYLAMPVWPGDVIMVPGGAQVLVAGWVTRPGGYNLSPGLTVTGIVIQAGDVLFPADVNSVKIIRAEKGGSKSFIFADLNKIKHGEAADIALQGGDIVEVSAETSKLVPYGLYRFFSSVFNAGVNATYSPSPK
jgi:polysaccharide biosynthesis/export protein